MSLRIGELEAVLDVNASRWERGLDRARVSMAGLQRDTSGRLRDMNGRFVSTGHSSGRGFSRGLLSTMSDGLRTGLSGAMQSGMSGLRGLSSAISSNPYVAAAGYGIATTLVGVALPAIAALFSAAVISVAGIAVIGLGYALLKGEPEVKKAASHLKKTVGDILKDAAAPMKDEFVDAFGDLEDLAKRTKPYVDRIFKAAAKFIDPLVKGFSDLVENALPGFTSMMEDAQPVFDGLSDMMGKIGEGLSIFFEEIGKSAPDAKIILEDLGTFLKGVLIVGGKFIGFLARTYSDVRDTVVSVIGWFQHLYDVLVGHSIIPDLVNAIVNWILSLPGRILGGLSNFVSNVIGYFGRMASGARNKVGDAVHWVAGLPHRAASALGNLGSYLYNSGSALIQGFISGIWSRIGGVRDAASSLLSAARDYFPFSPAKEGPFSGRGWTLYSGASLVDGFQEGIAQQLPALQAQLGGMPGVPAMGGPALGAGPATGRPQRVEHVLRVEGDNEDIVRLVKGWVRTQGGNDVTSLQGA